ncbi:phosphoribosylglycinamide formyltransferase [Marivirga sp. S37H4]|uniref:Phosphoribosylglycinamide formyltransferase n=1 Tax=Marivirga aurantiaca TaxID=2802615 RepID=A0A934WZX3_9BACT|nr:phosphoribosylglycinamide formyltransferase [Marivirga aurantiaca]MBK6265927.1 phosphoribosylglycinamide formyltransferase [Marivirga aurantiaca]
MTHNKKVKIALLASGSGTNAEKIIHYFKDSEISEVACVISNRQKAGVLERAQKAGVNHQVFSMQEFEATTPVLNYLQKQGVDIIVLAGFLLKLSPEIITAYPDKIINIHPALLPKYGGKGMYGHFVHEAVIKNRDQESGITIHLVNDEYDKGDIIFQTACPINPEMTPEQLAAKVQVLEHQHFPKVIEQFISDSIKGA